jgi:hypothetical protein
MVLFFSLVCWWFKDTRYYRDDYSQKKIYKVAGKVYGVSLQAEPNGVYKEYTLKLFRINSVYGYENYIVSVRPQALYKELN